ncbi:glycosyltransferase [Nakamurella silvestris]|nr:glycosyltransferase [Nakamurella silvestris]
MRSVLLCSTPVHGHVSPLLEVADHLVGTGYRVRFLTGARYRTKVLATGAEFLPLPPGADYDDTDMDLAFPDRAGLAGPKQIRHDLSQIFIRPVAEQLAAVDAALAQAPVDAVLAESLFTGAAALLLRPPAERPPVINLGIVPLSLKDVDTAPFGMGITPLPGSFGRWRNRLLYTVAEKGLFRPVQKDIQTRLAALTGRTLPVFFMDWPRLADALIQFTVPAFEYPRESLPATVHFVGPMSGRPPGGTAPAAPDLPTWWADLDGDRPVVHVTQGTVANKDFRDLILPTVQGLTDQNVLVVVSTGGPDPDRLGPLPGNVRVARYLPYQQLLPKVDVMVTNGGYGGIHFALAHGVPLVVAGKTEEKVEVTARVRWSGVGVDLRSQRPSPDAVRAAVAEVLSNRTYGAVAREVGRQIVAAPGLPGVAAVIESLRTTPGSVLR